MICRDMWIVSRFNAYLDNFYNHAAPPALYVPYSIWEKGGARELAEPKSTHVNSVNDAPAATEEHRACAFA